MKYTFLAVIGLAVFAQTQTGADFRTWWKSFQNAVTRRDTTTVTKDARFPMQWENGPTREVKSAADLAARFDFYFTPEIRNIIATREPAEEGRTARTITWKARGNEYSLYFKAQGNTWVLDGLSEGPP